jgi:hypothetical protein
LQLRLHQPSQKQLFADAPETTIKQFPFLDSTQNKVLSDYQKKPAKKWHRYPSKMSMTPMRSSLMQNRTKMINFPRVGIGRHMDFTQK